MVQRWNRLRAILEQTTGQLLLLPSLGGLLLTSLTWSPEALEQSVLRDLPQNLFVSPISLSEDFSQA